MKHKYGAYAGTREVDGKEIWFASRMEFNHYLYLRWLKEQGEIQDFQYQPKAFDFYERAKERPDLWGEKELPLKRRYQADFFVIEKDGSCYYVETVGKLRRDHNRNFKLLRLLYPEVKLRVMDRTQYRNIEQSVSGIIKGWERGSFKGQKSRLGLSRRSVYIDELTGKL